MKKIILLGIAFAFATGLFTGCSKFKAIEIPLQDFTSLSFGGYDGTGTVSGEVVVDDLVAYLLQEQPNRDEEALRQSLPQFAVSAEQKDSLASGDDIKIAYELDFSENQKPDQTLIFLSEPFTIRNDFPPIENVDVFDFLEVAITGEGESAEILLTNTYLEEPLNSIVFEAAEGSGLVFDSKPTIHAKYDEKALEEAGYRITRTELEIEIGARPELVAEKAPPLVQEKAPVNVNDKAPVIISDEAPANINDEAPTDLNDQAPEEVDEIAIADEPMAIDPNSPALGMDPGANDNIVYEEGRVPVAVNSDGTVTYEDELVSHDGTESPPYNPDVK